MKKILFAFLFGLLVVGTANASTTTINGTVWDDDITVMRFYYGGTLIEGACVNNSWHFGGVASSSDVIYVYGNTGDDRIDVITTDGGLFACGANMLHVYSLNYNYSCPGVLLSGDDGDDVLVGGECAEVLSGGDDNDTLFGGAGCDYLYGGCDSDCLSDSNVCGVDCGECGTDNDSEATPLSPVSCENSAMFCFLPG